MLGKFHGQRSLVGYSPWGHKELDITEVTKHWIQYLKMYTSNEVDTVIPFIVKKPKTTQVWRG